MNRLVNLKNLGESVVMNALRVVYEDWDFLETERSSDAIKYEVTSKDQEPGKLHFRFFKEDENNFLDLNVPTDEETEWTAKSVERLLEYIA